MRTAKVFQDGESQFIRLPEEFRIEAEEVYLKKTPAGFMVITRNPWELFYEAVEELPDDFMAEGRKQPPLEKRNWNP